VALAAFNGANGGQPYNELVQGSDGSFYGTTYQGGTGYTGSNFQGTVFKVTPGGGLTTLYNFCSIVGTVNGNTGVCIDGNAPLGPLAQAPDGNFYGTTSQGGTGHWPDGTVFRITPEGALTTIYNFCSMYDDTDGNCLDGHGPQGGLILGSDGNLYGTTSGGGPQWGGTVFRITTDGVLTTLAYFYINYDLYTDSPNSWLFQASDGNFYGATSEGNDPLLCEYGCGAIFRITPEGVPTIVHQFSETDGGYPSPVIEGPDGNLYGTTAIGGNGAYSSSSTYHCGTVFKMTKAGSLTTLYSFCNEPYCADGSFPNSGLALGPDGNFYGTTIYGGTGPDNACGDFSCGTIFRITPSGSFTVLYSFYTEGGNSVGYAPGVGPIFGTDGNLYGTTQSGLSTWGTVWRLDLGLSQFVELEPSSGWVGEAVTILGDGLTGATAVSFNGTVAKFTVVSNSEIETAVPAGATTGNVRVKTVRGTLTSNVPFQVLEPCVTGSCMAPLAR
jgi:uncharacterized repeat protein (TIGR03803 family)